MLIWLLEKIVFAKIKAKLAQKALAATGSATVGVLAGVTAIGLWATTHQDFITSVIGPKWGPVAVAVGALAVALARVRTL